MPPKIDADLLELDAKFLLKLASPPLSRQRPFGRSAAASAPADGDGGAELPWIDDAGRRSY